MIDSKAIKTKFKLHAQQQIGSYLAQVGSGENIPAVIDARPTYIDGIALPKPPYPYVTVDMFDLNDKHYYDANRYIDEDTELEVHQFYKRFMIRYQMLGGVTASSSSEDPEMVMNLLRNTFRLPLVIADIEDTTGATPHETTEIDNTPVRLSSYYLESAAFNVICEIVDSISDPDTFIIEEVDLDGEVYVLQDDEDGISVNVNYKQP